MNNKITLAIVAMAVAGLIALLGAPLFSPLGAASEPTLQGVWQITEVTTTGPNASTNNSPQPGLYIFTGKHYSIVRVNGTKPRPDLPADLKTATADQLLAVYGTGFTSQSGTYEVAGGKLTTRALVAKNTGPMRAGSFTTSSYKLDGKTLTITAESNQSGPVANPATYKLTRIE